ncbi:hypothetical protein J2045_003399 [Peteryoungia aggregata LMG 23059]|uniref:Zinc finger CHC2-type domain-containing protein n=2 Tax=Peteryoungia aggregata TaxID=34013 RepID=A0ABU0GAG8_9HYPH|nr:hypothetical protein [Peteryoungia aggregata LMG 23059]
MRFTEQFLDEIRERVPISEVVGKRVTWDRAKTRPAKGDYWACCPIHGEKKPSFHCEDKKGRYHCFGCGASGDHFKFLHQLDGLSFPRAVEVIANMAGIALPGGGIETQAEREERLKRERAREASKAKREREQARENKWKDDTVKGVWASATPIAGTLGEGYLVGRDLELMPELPGLGEWPPSLRFHPSLPFKGGRHPALIGGVQNVRRELVAIWRIFLGPDGKALVDEDGKKIKLGFGNASGAAVRFGPAAPTLRLAEGMETALAVQRLTRNTFSVWATLSTSGMVGLDIPPGVKRLEIYADGDRHRLNRRTGEVEDPPGIRAANSLRERAQRQGIETVIFPSPEPDDWLDVYQAKVRHQRLMQRRYGE